MSNKGWTAANASLPCLRAPALTALLTGFESLPFLSLSVSLQALPAAAAAVSERKAVQSPGASQEQLYRLAASSHPFKNGGRGGREDTEGDDGQDGVFE